MPLNNGDKLPFDPTLCQHCFQPEQTLKKCSRCKIMVYCCKEHQGLDWKAHRRFCGVVAEGRDKLRYNVKDFEWLRRFKVALKLFWEEKLGRKLDWYEETVWLSFEYCGFCFKNEDVKLCENCFCEGFCSDEHKTKNSQHKVFCEELKISREIDRVIGKTVVKIEDWYKAFQLTTALPTDINDLVDLGNCPNECLKRIYAHLLSPLGTLIFAINKANLRKENLKIHVVGASSEETKYNWSLSSILLTKFFPNVASLAFHFVGPELPTTFPSHHFIPTNSNSTFHFHRQCYHTTNLTPPDLIVIYNAGLHEFPVDTNPWTPSLQTLRNQNGLIVLTGYLEEEVLQDKQILGDDGLEVIFLGKNPFRSPKPFRNWDSAQAVYYSNNYVYIARSCTL